MKRGRLSKMMILSALMKMLLWTLPGATLRTRDNDHTPYQLLQGDLNLLNIHSSKLNCQQSSLESDLTPTFSMITDAFLRSLVVKQHPTAISSAAALAELLSQTAVDANESIRTLLRGLIRVNRVLSEAAFVLPVSALPPNARDGLDEKMLIVHAATRISRLANGDDSVNVNTSRFIHFYAQYKKLQSIQQKLIEEISIVQHDDREKLDDEFFSGYSKRPKPVIEKYCELDGSSQSETSTKKYRYTELRLILAFLAQQTTKADTAPVFFYVTLPLNSVDLNQCDDSPHPKLRGTHGCMNSTCVFLAGGGFELGHYKCCCQPKNSSGGTVSQSYAWLSETETHRNDTLWQSYDECFDGKTVEKNRLHQLAYPGQCVTYFEGDYTLRKVLLAVNVICAMAAFALIFVVMTQRKVQDWGARGWALMELFLLGAILLYSIVILEFLQPQTSTCGLIIWCRELGFALFYGAVVLKIHRNLFEHRVRKAHHVYIKEKDLLKYLLCIVAFTVIGLVAWTVTAVQAAQSTQLPEGPGTPLPALLIRGRTIYGNPYNVCAFFHWNIVWHTIEFAFLAYGAYLSYKARNTTWNERRQFAVAVFMEMTVSLVIIIVKKNMWLKSNPDTLLLLSFIQVHLTITLIIVMIMTTKFYYASLDPSARAHSIVSSGPNKPHPSLAKLRDNLVNGTVDFAEVPIAEMNPEDIRAELKRVYTQLRMYKLTNLYMENPHISKRKGGKKTSSKQTNRRFSIPTVPNKAHNKELKRLEADERSSLAKGTDDDKDSVGSAADLTIQSSPHNIYLSRTALAAAKKLQLDSDLSVRI